MAVTEAAASRAALRAERVTAGLDQLDRWLTDQVRSGLAGLERDGYGQVEQMAARMVDAQAPGVAGMLRGIPAELGKADWPDRVLEAFAGLWLLVRAHQRLDGLPTALAATVRSRVGFPMAKDDVLAGPGVHDEWSVLGGVDLLEGRLATRRRWLWGRHTGRWALWLAFAPPGSPLDSAVRIGRTYVGDLHFYPGSGQLRALLGDHSPAAGVQRGPATDLDGAARRFADLVAADPWADRMPVVVSGVPIQPDNSDKPWLFRDEHGHGCDLVGLNGDPWVLLAHAAAGPVHLLGEWSSAGLRPLSLLPDGSGRPLLTRLVR
jgi:hypothetical protein